MNPTADKWRALALSHVDLGALKREVADRGWEWESCGHVTANESMARALRESGARAINLAELTDLMVWDAMPGGLRVPISSYPRMPAEPLTSNAPGGPRDPVSDELSTWRRNILALRSGFGIRIDAQLRSYLRRDAADPTSGAVLRRSVRDYRAGLMFLIASNFKPEHFEASTPLLRVATDAWRHLETEIPEVANIRRDLWDEPDACNSPQTAHARSVRARVDETLARVFDRTDGRTRLIQHGFFFFTPQQWAMFRLLKAHPEVDQWFMVHDDGTNRAFETWRHYFIDRWGMPRPEHVSPKPQTGPASALQNALEGRRVDPAVLAPSVSVIDFRNPTQFVRHWALEQAAAKEAGRAKPRLYAPVSEDMERVIDRMSPGLTGTSVNLADLPIGQFLLAIHECIEFDSSGREERVLTSERLIDMAASGLLDTDATSGRPSANVPALRRAMPFFADRRDVNEWVTRATDLRRLVASDVAGLGPRTRGADDVRRIATAASNELRHVPWADLTDDEALAVVTSVERAKELIDEIVSDGQRKPDEYLAWIRRRLERAMANLTDEDRVKVEEKLQGVHLGLHETLDLEGIKEVVRIILGREAELGLDGSVNYDAQKHVADVRSLDVLGLQKSEVDIHLANLAETVFPAKSSPFRWPFAAEHVIESNERRVQSEIMRTRAETAQLGDMYLFWLALDGLADGAKLTLSWITESAGELANPSSLLTLLTVPNVRSPAVKEKAGGVDYSVANGGLPAGGSRPSVATARDAGTDTDRAAAIRLLDRSAVASAVVCPRRFVLQWAMGPSTSFQGAHQHSMLHGLVRGVMERRHRYRNVDPSGWMAQIERVTTDLWRHMTAGQRASSLHKRVISASTFTPWQWIFTLAGSKNGTKPLDRAYQMAKSPSTPIPVATVVGEADDHALPGRPSNVTKRECDMCPVAPRCAVRAR
jgi:hypothetical protein